MKQMKIPIERKIILDVDNHRFPYAFRTLEPVVFKEGNNYCCLLGPDRQAGILGCGQTVDAAIREWNKHLKEMILKNDKEDELFLYVTGKLNATVYKIN